MIGFNVKFEFNEDAVLKRAKKTRHAKLRRFGAFVRQTAKTSMRRRKKSSAPGQPPSAHAGHLRDLMYFAVAPDARNVVIGPVAFHRGEVPRLLEEGGYATMTKYTRWSDEPYDVVVHIKPRPFMAPAFQSELAKLPPQWRDSIRT